MNELEVLQKRYDALDRHATELGKENDKLRAGLYCASILVGLVSILLAYSL